MAPNDIGNYKIHYFKINFYYLRRLFLVVFNFCPLIWHYCNQGYIIKKIEKDFKETQNKAAGANTIIYRYTIRCTSEFEIFEKKREKKGLEIGNLKSQKSQTVLSVLTHSISYKTFSWKES